VPFHVYVQSTAIELECGTFRERKASKVHLILPVFS